jgi:hypothetical protein
MNGFLKLATPDKSLQLDFIPQGIAQHWIPFLG